MRRQDPAAGGISRATFDAHQPLICQIHALIEGTVGCLGRAMNSARGWRQQTGNHA